MVWTILLKGCVHRELEQYSKASEKKMLIGKAQRNYQRQTLFLKSTFLTSGTETYLAHFVDSMIS